MLRLIAVALFLTVASVPVLAADNYNAQPGAVRLWNLSADMTGGEPVASVAGQGTLVYQTTDWAADAETVDEPLPLPNQHEPRRSQKVQGQYHQRVQTQPQDRAPGSED